MRLALRSWTLALALLAARPLALTSMSLWLCALLASCRRTPTPAPDPSSSAPAAISQAPGAPASSSAPPAVAPPASSSAPPATSSAPLAASSAPVKPLVGGPRLDPKPLDVATGAFVALGAPGVVVRRKDDEMLIVRLGDKVSPLSDDGKLYARNHTLLIDRGEGAALYWISDGKLRRRTLDAEGKTGHVETLADDAEEGTTPHGVRNEGGAATAQDVVAYVGRRRTRDGERQARVWIEGKGSHALSHEGTGAASLAVVATGPGRLTALWSDARAALLPLHAVPLELDGAGEPRIGQESTLWMGPPSETFDNLTAVRSGDTTVALTALPRNGLEFGLAAVPVALGERPRDDAAWLSYPNGLDPAPAVGVRFCQKPFVVLVRPTDRPVNAPRVVQLASVEPSGQVIERDEIARAARVDHVAAWASPRGDGWVAWVGDGRTRVRRVRCGR